MLTASATLCDPELNHFTHSGIVLAGCTRNGLRDVYLLSLSYNDYPTSSGGNGSTALESSMSNQTKSLELRVGFLGACIELASEWTCSPAFSAITDRLSEIQFDANEDALSESYDPLGLLNVGKSFKDKVVFDGLMSVPFRLHPCVPQCGSLNGLQNCLTHTLLLGTSRLVAIL